MPANDDAASYRQQASLIAFNVSPGCPLRKPVAHDLSPGGGGIAMEEVTFVGHLVVRPSGMARGGCVRKRDRHEMIGGAMHDQHRTMHAVGQLVERSRMNAQSSE